jgi:hypothetical protein
MAHTTSFGSSKWMQIAKSTWIFYVFSLFYVFLFCLFIGRKKIEMEKKLYLVIYLKRKEK